MTDDAPAVQRLIDDALGGPPEQGPAAVRTATHPVVLPPGRFLIRTPLRVRSAMGLTLAGAGPQCTMLVASGPLDSVLDVDGAAYCRFADFSVVGDGTEDVAAALRHRWSGPAVAACSTYSNVVERVAVREVRCRIGLHVGTPGSGLQCDTGTYRNLSLVGAWDGNPSDGDPRTLPDAPRPPAWTYGVYCGDDVPANCLEHWFGETTLVGWRWGFTLASASASLTNINLGNNGTDLNVQSPNQFAAANIRSEAGGQFLVAGNGVVGWGMWPAVRNVLFETNAVDPHRPVVDVTGNGAVRLEHVRFNSQAPVWCRFGSGRGLDVVLDGCASAVPAADLYHTAGAVTVANLRYRRVDRNGTVIGAAR